MKVYSLILLAALCLLAHNAHSQFGNYRYRSYHYKSYDEMTQPEKTWSKRTYMGLSFPMMSLDMQQTYQIGTPGIAPFQDTSIQLTKNSRTKFGIKGAFGVMGGSCFKVARTGATSMIAIDLAIAFDIYHWSIGTVKYSKTDSLTDDMFCLQGAMPITLMYKSGPEVSFKNDNRVIFSIGGGFAPAAGAIGYAQLTSNSYFKLRSFLMAEIGGWGGMSAKLRVMYYPGTLSLINATGSDLPGYTGGGNLTVLANGYGNFVISLLILPVCTRWEEDSY